MKDPLTLHEEIARLWPAQGGRLWLVLSHAPENPLPQLLSSRWPGPILAVERRFVGIRVMLFKGDSPRGARGS